ncbi:hypothetical protein C8R43DRAFT_499109 [Mycena crocata]|nr:hypothetical protein C8R43DRAFT_499109 [Mycena crocata]
MYPSPSPTRSLVCTLSPFSHLTALQSYTTPPAARIVTLRAIPTIGSSSPRDPAQTATYRFVTPAPECISLTDENRDPSFFGSHDLSSHANARSPPPQQPTVLPQLHGAARCRRCVRRLVQNTDPPCQHFGRKGHTDERTDAFTASSSPSVDRVTDVPVHLRQRHAASKSKSSHFLDPIHDSYLETAGSVRAGRPGAASQRACNSTARASSSTRCVACLATNQVRNLHSDMSTNGPRTSLHSGWNLPLPSLVIIREDVHGSRPSAKSAVGSAFGMYQRRIPTDFSAAQSVHRTSKGPEDAKKVGDSLALLCAWVG